VDCVAGTSMGALVAGVKLVFIWGLLEAVGRCAMKPM